MYAIHYRFLETFDESFDYDTDPVPGQGRWQIHGIGLPDDVLRKVYRDNARRILRLGAVVTGAAPAVLCPRDAPWARRMRLGPRHVRRPRSRPQAEPPARVAARRLYTYRELVEAIARTLSLRRYLVSVPSPVWKAMAIAAQSLPGQGLTLNQVELMEQDNVAAGTGNLQELGVIPTPIANVVTALASQPAAETTRTRT